MICYKCGGNLGAGRHCLRCGTDVTIYKRIVRLSNSYYNAGLEKAKVRDLTGAIEALSKSLQFDKRNIQARNLLGLVYYEMGEVVEALCQWVISKNLKPENNLADDFLNQVQGNKAELDSMNQAVKKFNQALDYAAHDSEDLAVIQLRGVISQYPKMIKAYQLLALLYIKDGEYSKAGKILKRALSIDRGNTYCLKYTREIRGKMSKPKKQQSYLEQQVAQQAADEVIIPKYTEKPKILQTAIGLITGVAICVSAYFFLLQPTLARETETRWNQTIISYNEKIETRDTEISNLKRSIEDLQKQVDAMTREVEKYTGEDGSLTNYDRLLVALEQYNNEDWANLLETYQQINYTVITAESFRSNYKMLKEFIEGDGMAERIYQEGMLLFEAYKYSDAIETFKSCLELNPDYVAAIYYTALSYEASQDDASAAVYFKEIVTKYPGSEFYEQAKRRTG